MQTNPVVTRALLGGATDDHTANRVVSRATADRCQGAGAARFNAII